MDMGKNIPTTTGTKSTGSMQNMCGFHLDKKDVLLVLVDFQDGLMSCVNDKYVGKVVNNVVALGNAARMLGIPVFLTALNENGPNGQLLEPLEKTQQDAIFEPREEELNPWDSKNFVERLESIGRKTLILAGSSINVSLAFTALSASCCGYRIFTVIDASGAPSKLVRTSTIARLSMAGVIPVDTFSIISQLLRFHRLKDDQWNELFTTISPKYKNLVLQYWNVKRLTKPGSQTDTYIKDRGQIR